MYSVFVDSDVVISSLISEKGAAYFTLHRKDINPCISSVQITELNEVIDRLRLDRSKFNSLAIDQLETVALNQSIKEIKLYFKEYVIDEDDAHIVAGAKKAKVSFLVYYNIRHFKVEKIKRDFNILIKTPGGLLQYL